MKTLSKTLLILLPLLLMAQDVTVEQLFNVQTVKVKKELRSEQNRHYGYVVMDQTLMYDISPRFGGYVLTLYGDEIYKKVRKGDPLAKVYSPEVFKAKEEYINTIRYTQKRPDKSMLESARLKLQLLGVNAKEINALASEMKASPNTTIYSPVNGYIFNKTVNKGSAFKAAQLLFRLVNLDTVWVEAKLTEEERPQLSDTDSFRITFKGLKKVYTTDKKLLYPQLDPKVATLTLRLPLNNKDHKLFPGMYASIDFLQERSEQLILPATAVIRKDGKHYVFIVGEYEGEYEPLEVDVTRLDGKSYAIIDGLNEGDEVVNNALFMMDSDAQINGLY